MNDTDEPSNVKPAATPGLIDRVSEHLKRHERAWLMAGAVLHLAILLVMILKGVPLG